MKGVVVATLMALAIMGCNIALANPPILPPMQYEQFCEAQKIAGTGIIDASTSIVDKKIALEYYNAMAGDGDLELDQEHAYSQNLDKLTRNISSVNDGNESNLNLFEKTKLTYSGETPLTGSKYLHSKEFYGGIGAEIQESFSVNQMEKEQTTFFASTTPYRPKKQSKLNTNYWNNLYSLYPLYAYYFGPYYAQYYSQYYGQYYDQYYAQPSKGMTPEDLIDSLKAAGADDAKVAELMGNDPAHLIGIETKNKFNGTWGTDSKWHKIFYKDIKTHEMFSGQFETEKVLKFHENPVPENGPKPCAGIDC
jgi:hypothetical protein